MKPHWKVMSGDIGCANDSESGPYYSLQDAINAACREYQLGPSEHLRFEAGHAVYVGRRRVMVVLVDNLPADYEECGTCGYDHDYAPAESAAPPPTQEERLCTPTTS